MSRPLLITDCDEVLLHMVSPFAGWLDEAHAIDFDPACGDFTQVYRRSDGAKLTDREIWPLLDSFFAAEMHRQRPVPGAVEALEAIGEVADIISSTVAKWDGKATSERLELQVGRDLQFIRINGTLVGGLAGLVIYSVSRLLF